MVAQNSTPAGRRLGKRGWLFVVGAGVGALILGAVVYLFLRWPFTKSEVAKSLEEASSSKVELGNFRTTYFPHPGCIVERVVIHQGERMDLDPIVTIQRLTARSNILRMLTKHVAMVQVEGMKIFIPQQSEHKFKSSSDVIIDKLIADDASLKFESRSKGKPGLEFKIHHGELSKVGEPNAVNFHVRLFNPLPPGEIEASGKFGPWVRGHAG